ncbi:MAG: hypothetical protein KAQ62_06725, partial [Cyclobacteriaceae bacterium]|nr:hypothetical protein [Cyclobacteriaceae bacterium]
MGYFENNTDSALHYADKALQLARKNNYHLDEAQILQVKIWLLMRRGLFSESLQLLFEARDKLQNQELSDYVSSYLKSFYNNDEPEILRQLILANSDYLLGRLYAEVGNHENSLSLFSSAKQQFAKFNAVYPLRTLNFRIVLYYISQSKLDSALIFVKESEELFAESAEFLGYWNGYSNGYKGGIYLNRRNYDSSKWAYKSALAISSHEKNFRHQTEMYNGLAKVFLALDSTAVAQDYTSLAIRNGISEGQQEEIATAYFTKSSIFDSMGVMDSAFYYLALANKLADSLQQAKFDNVSQFNATLLEGNLRNRDLEKERIIKENQFQTNSLLVALGLFSLIGFVLYRNNRQKQKANSVLESTLSNLKSTQSQLIQSEKMASLGELTAGIAHEIQNPLNFVNNFSEVNKELISELKEEVEKGDLEEIKAIANDIKGNEEKINHHGQRASGIVKGMLEHSRAGDG